jgi:response regulator RpfG family c-di-GMP phosphodiesterase
MIDQPPSAPRLDDELSFCAEEPERPRNDRVPWKILVADDDEEIHIVTQMVLRDLVFESRPVRLLAARSGHQALQVLAEHPDTAIVLLDVVMEADDAGLEVAHKIRDTLDNHLVRIILRTGQPGQAPEKSVVIDYDINDYKEKTELTAQKLITAVISGLRSYRDLQTIERSRRGLTQIIDASRDLFAPQSLARLSSGVLAQLTAMLHLGENGLLLHSSGLAAGREGTDALEGYSILSGTGRFAGFEGRNLSSELSASEVERILRVRRCEFDFASDEFIGRFCASNGSESIIFLQTERSDDELDFNLIRLFASNIGIAFDNIHLKQELASTQAELVHTLSEVVETRSKETGLHVVRVGVLSEHLARLAGHSEEDCALLLQTAPMHDLGKVGIPDAILHKPGRLSPEEWEIMKTHSALGYALLHRSKRRTLQTAALIAEQHHEWWDGSGYPTGRKGEEIHPFGRIVALIDVFDALSHPRCYKSGWELEAVVDYIRKQRGVQFDPYYTDIFLANLEQLVGLWHKYPEPARAE